jgi:hypothetical protein
MLFARRVSTFDSPTDAFGCRAGGDGHCVAHAVSALVKQALIADFTPQQTHAAHYDACHNAEGARTHDRRRTARGVLKGIR